MIKTIKTIEPANIAAEIGRKIVLRLKNVLLLLSLCLESLTLFALPPGSSASALPESRADRRARLMRALEEGDDSCLTAEERERHERIRLSNLRMRTWLPPSVAIRAANEQHRRQEARNKRIQQQRVSQTLQNALEVISSTYLHKKMDGQPVTKVEIEGDQIKLTLADGKSMLISALSFLIAYRESSYGSNPCKDSI